MIKQATLQRFQAVMNIATQAIEARRAQHGEDLTLSERMTLELKLAQVLLEEDDRQQRTIVIPGRS